MIDKKDFPRFTPSVPSDYLKPTHVRVRDKIGIGCVGAEIGILLGEYSEYVLRNLKPKMYYMIDPYEPFGDMLRSREDWNTLYEWIYGLFKDRPNCKFIRARSADAVSQIKDNELDFIWIDGDHEYEAVKKDIELYWPKVKSGGVMGGDNYADPNWPNDWPGVKIAVDEFGKKMGLRVNIEGDSLNHIDDWWIDKP